MFYQFTEVVFRGRTIRYITPEPSASIDPLVEVLKQTKRENEGIMVVIMIPDPYTSNFITDNKSLEDIEFWDLYKKSHSPHIDCSGPWTRAYFEH